MRPLLVRIEFDDTDARVTVSRLSDDDRLPRSAVRVARLWMPHLRAAVEHAAKRVRDQEAIEAWITTDAPASIRVSKELHRAMCALDAAENARENAYRERQRTLDTANARYAERRAAEEADKRARKDYAAADTALEDAVKKVRNAREDVAILMRKEYGK